MGEGEDGVPDAVTHVDVEHPEEQSVNMYFNGLRLWPMSVKMFFQWMNLDYTTRFPVLE